MGPAIVKHEEIIEESQHSTGWGCGVMAINHQAFTSGALEGLGGHHPLLFVGIALGYFPLKQSRNEKLRHDFDQVS